MTKAALPVVVGSPSTTSGGASIEPDRSADIVEAPREAALLGRKPFRVAFMPAGLAEPSARTQQAAQAASACQLWRRAMRHADQRPGDGEHRQPDFQSDHVKHVAADRLQHDGA